MLILTNVPNIVVTAYDKNFIWLSRNITDACERNCSLIEIFVLIPHSCLPLQQQIVEVSTSTHVTTSETTVIAEPIDAPYSVDMTLANHVTRAITSVEVENVNCNTNRTGE